MEPENTVKVDPNLKEYYWMVTTTASYAKKDEDGVQRIGNHVNNMIIQTSEDFISYTALSGMHRTSVVEGAAALGVLPDALVHYAVLGISRLGHMSAAQFNDFELPSDPEMAQAVVRDEPKAEEAQAE